MGRNENIPGIHPGKSTSLLRFSSESTESNYQGRSPGSSDFCSLLKPITIGSMASGAKAFSLKARADLQLRGQLRYYTGFPFNPKGPSQKSTGFGNLHPCKERGFYALKNAIQANILESRPDLFYLGGKIR